MTLAVPLALLALLAIPVVVVLHFMAARWKSREVSSLALWEEALRQIRTSLRVRRLLRLLALLAEALAVAALAIALAAPQGLLRRPRGRGDTVLVLDVSASMQARDGRGTRWDEARERALDLVASLGRGARMAIVEAGREPRLRAPFSDDRRLLREAVLAARPTDEPGDPAGSLLFALGLREPGRTAGGSRGAGTPPGVVFITDGAFDSLGEADPARSGVRLIEVGAPAPGNVGITALQFRTDSAGGRELFVSIANSGAQRVTVPLAVSVSGERPVFERDFTLEPGQGVPVAIPWTGSAAGKVTARIGGGDALPVDDAAYAVLAPARTLRVLMVGPDDPFLREALSAFPGVRLSQTAGLDSLVGGRDLEQWDLVVIEGVAAPPLERGRYLLFATVPPGLPIAPAGSVPGPRFESWDRSHPVLAGLALAQVVIERALRVAPGPGVRVLASYRDTPLVATWEREGLTVLFVAFTPAQSDLPLRPAFPMLIAQALAWFQPGLLGGEAAQVHPGDPFEVAVPPEAKSVVVAGPDGTRRTWDAAGPSFTLADTQRAGFYRIEAGSEAQDLAVSLCDAGETNLARRYAAPAADAGAAADADAAAAADADAAAAAEPAPRPSAESPSPQPLWPVFVLVAFVLMAAEGALWAIQRAPVGRTPGGAG